MTNFIFLIYLLGLIIATIQDVKRREVDDWLNFSLFFAGAAFILLNQPYEITGFAFFVFIGFLLSVLLYYGRFFAGGDAKLLFAMTPLFYQLGFTNSLINFGFYLLALVFCGAIYGLVYLAILSIKRYPTIKSDFHKNLGNKRNLIIFIVATGLCFFLSLFYSFFIFFFIFFVLFYFLFSFGKAIEKKLFISYRDSRSLKVGDWLVNDVKIGSKLIKANWDGLTAEEIKLLSKKRIKVEIKEGIPYVPAFLFALLIYLYFLSSFLAFF